MTRRVGIILYLVIGQIVLMLVLLQCTPKDEAAERAAAQSAPADPKPITNVSLASDIPLAGGRNAYVLFSPDGQYLASTNPSEICLYHVESQQNQCYPLPDEVSLVSPSWSPDSHYIAFTEDTFRYQHESDVWVLDTTTGEYTNLTDDGFTGGYGLDDEGLLLDYQPTWNPATGELYFFRTELRSAPEITDWHTTLNRITINGGEPEEMLDVTDTLSYGLVFETFPGQVPLFGGAVRISPDGSQMAVLVRSVRPDEMADVGGIWLIDLESKTPRKLTPYPALSTGLPAYTEEHLGSLVPTGLSWAASGRGLVVFSVDYFYITQPPSAMAYYVDADSGATTPIIDFSDITEEEQFDPPPHDTFRRPTPSPTPVPNWPDRLFQVPRAIALSSDGSILYMFNRGWSQWGITAVTLPPDGSAPVQVYTGAEDEEIPPAFYSTSGGNRVLLGYLLFEIEE